MPYKPGYEVGVEARLEASDAQPHRHSRVEEDELVQRRPPVLAQAPRLRLAERHNLVLMQQVP